MDVPCTYKNKSEWQSINYLDLSNDVCGNTVPWSNNDKHATLI